MWKELELEIELCSKCALERIRRNPVIGKGSHKAEIMLVMSNISSTEDKNKDLLTDRNGEYFKKFMKYSKIDVRRCYFTALTKCSSHGEYIKKEMIAACSDFLTAQIALLNPRYIITVGERATKAFIRGNEDIKEMVGKSYPYAGKMRIVPLYDKDYLFKASDKEKWKLIKILDKIQEELDGLQ